MNRQVLIDKIVYYLREEGALDVDNYVNVIEQCQDVKKIIENILTDYVIIEDRVI